MKSKLKKIIGYITEIKMTRTLLSMHNSGFFIEKGWFNSYKINQSVDKNNKPIPWVTYSFIDFIEPYLTNEKIIFEFGSGNSTLYYEKRVKKVYTVEHDLEWFNKIKQMVAKNVVINFFDINTPEYVNNILQKNEIFDIIIIDGRKRNECLKASINKISENGIIVLDDSERTKYKEGTDFLRENNFLRIDFWGPSPGYFHNKCTSIFCKNFNKFLINK